jgi:hypothetical protein
LNGVFPDVGLGYSLEAMLAGGGPITVHLFKNTAAITRTLTLAQLIEADFSGYSTYPLGPHNPSVADPVNHLWSCSFPALTWQNTTGSVGNQIYGVFMTIGSGILLYAEEVSGGPSQPIDMGTAGKTYVYTPLFQMLSQFATSP